MRILVLAQYFPPRRSTFASRWAWLTKFLAERGHEVEVVAFLSSARQLGNLKRAFESDPPPCGVRFHPVLPVLRGQGLATRAVADVAGALRGWTVASRIKDADVVVASVPSLVLVPLGWLVARTKRRPLVVDLRDAWPELVDDWREWNDDGRGPRPLHPLKRIVFPPAASLVKRVVGAVRRDADAVVVTTQRLADRLRDEGIQRVTLVRNTSTKPWPWALPRVPEESDALRVLYLGNVGRAQLLATGIRALARARANGAPVILRIVGGGAHVAAVQAIARQEGVDVEFVERVPTYGVLEHYRWADTVLVPLRGWASMEETVPSKLYEIMVAGRHISASVAGETAELVTRLQAGDVVPPEDVDALAALWTLLARERWRLNVPHRGRYWVRKELMPESLSRTFEAVLSDVVAG